MSLRRQPAGEGSSGRVDPVPPRVCPELGRRRMPGGGDVKLVRQTRTYELITPLFGGGVDERAADPVTLIRASEIRGQLRFWWRACRGGRYGGDLDKMREAEGELWGWASTPKKPRPSKVQVAVTVIERGQVDYVFERRAGGKDGSTVQVKPRNGWGRLAYAAFPLQDDTGSGSCVGRVLKGVKFDVDLVFPESERAEVEAALWAWETFGGMGGRTRRGFGAMRLLKVGRNERPLPAVNEMVQHIRDGLRQHVLKGDWPDGVPHLSVNLPMDLLEVRRGAHAAGEEAVEEAWERLIDTLRRFRQSRARGPSSRAAQGRSDWPEADELRRLDEREKLSRRAIDASAIRKFPRGALGLPIVFRFKGDPSRGWVLQGSNRRRDRFTSPVILRPLACKDGAVGLVAILEGTRVSALRGQLIVREKLEEGKQGAPLREFSVDTELTPDEAKRIKPLDGQADVLKAFLEAVRREKSGATRRG